MVLKNGATPYDIRAICTTLPPGGACILHVHAYKVHTGANHTDPSPADSGVRGGVT